jgi:hypothetical protein
MEEMNWTKMAIWAYLLDYHFVAFITLIKFVIEKFKSKM